MSERQRPADNETPRAPVAPSHIGQRARRDARGDLPGETELLGMVQAGLQSLSEEVAAGKSERLQRYLAFASRFHTYSRANQWLILAQMPTATRVASYRKWQEEGYQVAQGQRGIRILAPRFKRRIDEETKEEEQALAGFIAVSVFDASRLTPEKRPPEFFTPVAGDYDAFYGRLKAAATEDGFDVLEAFDTHGAEGYSRGRTIVTRRGLTSANRALTAIHEYAHGLLHQSVHALQERRELTRGVKECHAEATAYVVAHHFGLPRPLSSDYLLQWGATPETLRTELDTVIKAASHIISRIHDRTPARKALTTIPATPQCEAPPFARPCAGQSPWDHGGCVAHPDPGRDGRCYLAGIRDLSG